MPRRVAGAVFTLFFVLSSSAVIGEQSFGLNARQQRDLLSKSRQILYEAKRDTTIRPGPGVEIIMSKGQMIPPSAAFNLSRLIELMTEEFPAWKQDRPVIRIYLLDYERYEKVFNQVTKLFQDYEVITTDTVPYHRSAGFFFPLQTDEYAVVIYEWRWYVLLHELVHHALMELIGPTLALNHSAVDPAVGHLWQSSAMIDLVRKATKGESYQR